MIIKPGTRLQSHVCETEVVVIRVPDGEIELQCGGHAMVAAGTRSESPGAPQSGLDTGSLLGKRYSNESIGVEVLCTKSGSGSVTANGIALEEKKAKPLPSSD